MSAVKEINFEGRFKVDGYRGIAFYLLGYSHKMEPVMCYDTDEHGEEIEVESGEFEKVEDRDHVIAVMVGDDRKHTVSVDDIEEIGELDYCASCGQIGCQHDGRDRE